MIAYILRLAANPLAARAGLVAVLLALLLYVRHTGYAACQEDHARRTAKEAAEWAEKIHASEAAAYERGLQAARVRAANEERENEIGHTADDEMGADDVCLSADIVERLRELE